MWTEHLWDMNPLHFACTFAIFSKNFQFSVFHPTFSFFHEILPLICSNYSRFISSSSDGHLCLWDIQDGRCIDSVSSLFIHRYMQPYVSGATSSITGGERHWLACAHGVVVQTYKSSRHTRSTRLFCIGDYSDVVVMDPQDLTVVFQLSSRFVERNVLVDWWAEATYCGSFKGRAGLDLLLWCGAEDEQVRAVHWNLNGRHDQGVVIGGAGEEGMRNHFMAIKVLSMWRIH